MPSRALGSLPQRPDATDAADRADQTIREVLAEHGMDAAEALSQLSDVDTTDMGDAFTLSDLGNAKRLVHHHGADIRFVHKWGGKWLGWDGRRFRPDESGEIVRRAKDTARRIYHEAATADPDDRKALARHALQSESAARIQAMISLAESEPGIPATPEDLDRDPWVLNTLSGTIDLRTGELRPHRRRDLLTKLAPAKTDPDAQCPEFERFIDTIMCARPDLVAFLQRALGYSLIGGNSERVLFVLHGGGRNGKSTLIETIAGVLGDYAGIAPSEMLLAKREAGIPNDLARLPGTRFVSAIETGEGRRLDEAKVKGISGGDTISARFMRGEWFDFRPTFTMWLGTNHRPEIRGTDNAIWDRIRLIPFDHRVPDTERVPDLAARMIDREAPGIIAWLVRGCLQWQAEGLGMPGAVQRANATYREDMDVLGDWIADRCELRAGVREGAGALYSDYLAYCQRTGDQPLKQRMFGTRLTEHGCGDAKSGGTRYRTGIRLIDPNEPMEAGFDDADMSQTEPPRDDTSHDVSNQKPHNSMDFGECRDARCRSGHDLRHDLESQKVSRVHRGNRVPICPTCPTDDRDPSDSVDSGGADAGTICPTGRSSSPDISLAARLAADGFD